MECTLRPRQRTLDSAIQRARARVNGRGSNYLSLSRPQTQLVQRAQWAQYPVEEIAMFHDHRSFREHAERQPVPDESRDNCEFRNLDLEIASAERFIMRAFNIVLFVHTVEIIVITL